MFCTKEAVVTKWHIAEFRSRSRSKAVVLKYLWCYSPIITVIKKGWRILSFAFNFYYQTSICEQW